MRRTSFALVLLITNIALAQSPATQPTDLSAIVPAGAKVEKIAGDMQFIEGPVWVGDHLIFSDIPNSRINRWTEKDGVTVFRTPSNNTNPVRRGSFIVQKLLCNEIPLPSGDILAMVKPPDPYSSSMLVQQAALDTKGKPRWQRRGKGTPALL